MLIARALTVLALGVVLLTGSRASSGESFHSRQMLKNLSGVLVLVEPFDENNSRAGFDEGVFQTDVELKLRMAGIRVLTEAEQFDAPGMPSLLVQVAGLHTKPGEKATFVSRVQLLEAVRLVRDPSVSTIAETWSSEWLGRGDVPHIRERIKDHTDQFINAWLSVNPKE